MKFKIFLLALLAFESTLISAKFKINKILAKYESKESSLTNCGPDTDPLKITSLYLQPSTLSLPGTIIAKGSARLNLNITGPLSVSLKIIKMLQNLFKINNVLQKMLLFIKKITKNGKTRKKKQHCKNKTFTRI